MSSRRFRLSAPAVGLIFAGFLHGQTPVVREVRNAASLASPDPDGQGIAPRSIVAIKGENLASETAEASGFPLPTTPAGTRVLFNGQPAPLLYVSPTQINTQVPSAVVDPKGVLTRPVEVVVSTNSGPSTPLAVPVTGRAPGLFTRSATGCGQGVILNVHADGSLSENRPDSSFDREKDVALAVFGTGFGLPFVGAQPDGMAWQFDPKVNLGFGGILGVEDREGALPQLLSSNYSGPSPGLAGIDQVNLLPRFGDEGRALLPEGCSVPLYVTEPPNTYTRSQVVAASVHGGGGQCVDPPPDSYAVFRWEHGEEGGTVADALVIRLWAQPGLRLVTDSYRRLGPGPGGSPGFGVYIEPPPAPKTEPCRPLQARVLDAGTITVRGPGIDPITASADLLTEDGEYRVPLPTGSVRGGQYEIRASGGVDIGPFISAVQIPEPIRITTDLKPGAEIPSRVSDIIISWTGGLSDAMAVATLRVPLAPGVIRVRRQPISALAGSLNFIAFPGELTVPSTDNAELTIELFPNEEPQFSARGLTEGGAHTWRYEFRFPGLRVR